MQQQGDKLQGYLLVYVSMRQVKIDAEQIYDISHNMCLKWSCFWLDESMQICALVVTTSPIRTQNIEIQLGDTKHAPLVGKLTVKQFYHIQSLVENKYLFTMDFTRIQKQLQLQELIDDDDSPKIQDDAPDNESEELKPDQQSEAMESEEPDYYVTQKAEPSMVDPLMLFLQRISGENKRLFYLNESISVAHIESLLTGQLNPHQLFDLAFWNLQSKDPDVLYILTDPKLMKDLLGNQIEKVIQALKQETERYRSHKYFIIPLYLDHVHSLLLLNRLSKTLTHYSIGTNIDDISMQILRIFNILEEALTYKKGVYYNKITHARCPNIRIDHSALATLKNIDILLKDPKAVSFQIAYSQVELERFKVELIDNILRNYLADPINHSVVRRLIYQVKNHYQN